MKQTFIEYKESLQVQDSRLETDSICFINKLMQLISYSLVNQSARKKHLYSKN